MHARVRHLTQQIPDCRSPREEATQHKQQKNTSTHLDQHNIASYDFTKNNNLGIAHSDRFAVPLRLGIPIHDIPAPERQLRAAECSQPAEIIEFMPEAGDVTAGREQLENVE